MRWPLVALLAAVPALWGCATTAKDRLEGRWVGDTVDSFPASQRARALGWAKGTAISFEGARVTVSIPAESPREGTYKLAELGPDELKVTFLRPHGAADEVTFRFEGEDRLRWMLGDGRSIVLRKADD